MLDAVRLLSVLLLLVASAWGAEMISRESLRGHARQQRQGLRVEGGDEIP